MKMKNPRVLVIDDESIIRDSFSRVLSEDGYNVTTASSGASAIAYASQEQFDIALLDLKMGDMYGLDIASAIQKIQKHLKIIVVTGYGSVEAEKDANELGITSFISKPISPDALANIVEQEYKKEYSVISEEEIVPCLKKFVNTASIVANMEKIESIESKSLLSIVYKMAYGSILGLIFVMFLPIVGLGMLGWLCYKKFC